MSSVAPLLTNSQQLPRLVDIKEKENYWYGGGPEPVRSANEIPMLERSQLMHELEQHINQESSNTKQSDTTLYHSAKLTHQSNQPARGPLVY
jgi:hypothetical protein